MLAKMLFVVNKDGFNIDPSETFLKAQLEGMKCETISLIGYPGKRCINSEERFLPSRKLLPLAFRWLGRRLALATTDEQDVDSLCKYIKSEKIDLVLAEYGPTAVSVMAACARADVPLVAHFHGWDAYTQYNIATYGERYKHLFEQVAAVVAVSNHMREQLISLGANPENIFHNACGAEVSGELRAYPAKADKRYIMVGRLTEKKAPICSIKAFSMLLEEHPDAVLEVIGDGDMRAECEELCDQLGIAGSVSFHGARPHADVLAGLARARCFIQHSVRAKDGDHEGTPVGVLEAMGMGLPVVATRHGGILDLIDTDQVGSLVDEHNIDGMSRAMARFAKDPMLAQDVGERARELVLQNWTSEKSIERLWDIIKWASATYADD